MKRTVELNGARITNRNDTHAYMQEVFQIYDASMNLDALYDNLTEVNDEVDLILTPDNVKQICSNSYSYKVLMVIGRAADHNPHLHVIFRK